MCEPASFVVTKEKVYWSKKSDSHEDIIEEFGLHADGIGGPNIVRTEISPPKGDLSLPLDQWVYGLDQKEVPGWYEAKTVERDCRVELKKWSKAKSTGWNVKEAFSPVNPFLLERRKMPKGKLKMLVADWASARTSVGDSVRDSVGASVWAYIGGLFSCIKSWKHAEQLGPDPWRPLLTLWYAGYVPSFDGKTWSLHAGKDAQVVAQWSRKEIEKLILKKNPGVIVS
jgi:hypothetical protein